jgi:glycosyltransferase involved in cell wall biosynthesis
MLAVIKRLDKRLFKPYICVEKRGGEPEKIIEELQIPLLEAPFTVKALPYPGLFFRIRKAASFFKQYKFALWNSFHYLDDYTEPLIARMAGTRKWMYTKKNMSWNNRSWFLRSLFASHILAVNTDMLKYFFKTAFFRRKTTLSPRGVDTEQFRPDAPAAIKIRARLEIPEASLLIGCIAHLIPIKGHQYLLRSLAQLEENIHLLVAGREQDKEYSESLKKLTQELNISHRVHFVGRIDNIPALLPEIDIYVLPTVNPGEGCPVSTLEAMSAARACVVTDVPGSRDLIVDGESGFLAMPEDPGSLARALKRFTRSSDLMTQMGRAARDRAICCFSIEKEVARHESVYAGLLNI